LPLQTKPPLVPYLALAGAEVVGAELG